MLTDEIIKNLENKGKQYTIYDGNGLHVFVSHRGTRFWRLKYRIGGREQLFSIGSADLITVDEAREKADSARKLISEGINPTEIKNKMKSARCEKAEKKYVLTEKDKALADYIIKEISKRLGLSAEAPF